MQVEKTDNLQNFSLRLRGRCGRAGLKQVQVARKLGVKPSRVGNWFQGLNYPTDDEAQKLARLLGESVDFLLHGRLSTASTVDEPVVEERGPEQPLIGLRYVPVVSWAHAGEATAYEQLPVDQQERVASTSTDKMAVAVTVEGESMLPDFKPGDRVILAPSREPRHGRPVVAKLADDGIVLRIYHRLNGNVVRLSSLRPEIYPTIDYAPQQLQWIWPVEELSRKI